MKSSRPPNFRQFLWQLLALCLLPVAVGCARPPSVTISDARFTGPRVAFKVHNGSSEPIRRLRGGIFIAEPGGTVPFDAVTLTFDVPGGIESGESKEVIWPYLDSPAFMASLKKHKDVPRHVEVQAVEFISPKGVTHWEFLAKKLTIQDAQSHDASK